MKTFIYILIDPRDNQVKYVGKTKNIKRRFYQHISEASKIKTHKNNWILSLKNNDLKPEMIVIDEYENDSWIFFEQWYIQLFKSWGYKLTNLTKGGEGLCGYKHTIETRQKVAKGNRGKIMSIESREKISASLKGTKHTNVSRANMSKGAKIRGISPETRVKMVASRKENGNYLKSDKTKKLISEKLKITLDAKRKNKFSV